VQDELRDSNAAGSLVARARLAFLATGEEKYAQAFESGLPDITKTLDRLQALTHDNPKQQELCSQLRKVTQQRIAISQKSIVVRRSSPQDSASQEDVTKDWFTAESKCQLTLHREHG
jgi:CHASE3 domain sensor protein